MTPLVSSPILSARLISGPGVGQEERVSDPWGPDPTQLSSTDAAMPRGHMLHPVMVVVGNNHEGILKVKEHLFPCITQTIPEQVRWWWCQIIGDLGEQWDRE